ncbi:AbrB family transcriptional regulator [Roseobacter denitrificans]|uniref:AbrB family transcriptional regulator n=1 Tax=Roseobacter denitrificans TaxID=2434 RepID=UPI000318F650|nr:AbrB family transcriptional regulator [Roseobacter denitrificans]AVL54665.1 AbrB family transcriptional regulator [Roseobacter denitrificans]
MGFLGDGALRYVTPFVFALSGAWLFHVLDLPLPWLIGPIAACLAAALMGFKMRAIAPVNAAMRTILGVAVGATFTPAILSLMVDMWVTLLLIPVMICCVAAVGVPYFQKLWGYDFATSYYSAMPGGLQDMLVFGEEAGGNPRTLSLIHATRILVIVTALPFLLQSFWSADLSTPPGAPLTSIAPGQLTVMLICAALGWYLANLVGLFGASILGPMIFAGAAAVTEVLIVRPPAEAIWAAQFFIGMTVGVKYSGITLDEVRHDLAAGLGYCVVLLLITFVFVEIVYIAGLAPGREALLAFAPGGQAEMAVLALIVGADMAFVIAHHVFRIIVIIIGAPLFARFFGASRCD